MVPSLRQRFNEAFRPEKYDRFLALMEERTGLPARFRLSETPVFLPRDLVQKMASYGREMVESLLADETYRRVSDDSIPPQFRVPNEANHPMFIQVDFGLDQDLEPKLVEIQGFPSLYAFQPVLAGAYADAYGIDLHHDGEYEHMLKDAIVGDHDPGEVVLLEIDPANQKTYADFLLTERICGIRTVDIRNVRKRGNRLYDGNDVPIRRIYNRAIVDELVRKDIPLAFDWRDDLDVEWAGHPNWFFRLSKFSLPFMKHVSVPDTRFVDDLTQPVEDPENWVLKPLFSFAGLGVVVGPTQDQIEAAKGNGFVLQRRVNFRPVVVTPYGMTKIEIRMMYIWRETFDFVNMIIRSGRGAQMGVDFNKGLEWVGASAAFTA